MKATNTPSPEGLNAPEAVLSIVSISNGFDKLEVNGPTEISGSQGTLTISPDGSYEYYAHATVKSWKDATDQFAYSILDRETGQLIEATMKVIVDKELMEPGSGSRKMWKSIGNRIAQGHSRQLDLRKRVAAKRGIPLEDVRRVQDWAEDKRCTAWLPQGPRIAAK